LKVFKETGSLNAVVDYMIEETKYGLWKIRTDNILKKRGSQNKWSHGEEEV
jgi:hypothetical protein